ncbi:MAG: condensation domain-containing protein [Aquabacterium sp.]
MPQSLVEALKQRAQAQPQGGTLFMVLLAGLQALLHRYSGQCDIRVGVPIANRHRVETEGVVGFFVNTQVLRNRIDARSSPLQAVLRPGLRRPRWARRPTRTCPSSNWSRRCSPSAASATARCSR